MKYRSYNSEILIATTLLVDVFNDIIIDRRDHGPKLDYKKGITLKDIVQQKIEVPCIVGDRGIIFKSLENETGAYRMPLIIMEMSGMKTDSARFADIHADVFIQQDDRFDDLEYDNPHYKPIDLSKHRGQPVDISFKVTFVTKYREDLDQILSNFIVHFRPDIYLKWWHPRIKTKPLDMEILWDHSVNYENVSNYDPKNIFKYTATCTFTLKTWLFYGLLDIDDNDYENLILKVKIFTGDDWDVTMPTAKLESTGERVNLSSFNEDEMWLFGDLLSTPSGLTNIPSADLSMGRFHGAATGDDLQELADLALLSGFNGETDDIMFRDYLHGKNNDHYQGYLSFGEILNVLDVGPALPTSDDEITCLSAHSLIKNAYFHSSYPMSAMNETPPSGDYMFMTFANDTNEFGQTLDMTSDLYIYYDVDTRNLIFETHKETDNNSFDAKCLFNSISGGYQEFRLSSQMLSAILESHKEFDNNFNLKNTILNNVNILPIESISSGAVQFDFQCHEKVLLNTKRINLLRKYIDKIDLVERLKGKYAMHIKSKKIAKELQDIDPGSTSDPFIDYRLGLKFNKNGKQYQVYWNKWMYLVLEVEEDNADIYDIGLHFPLTYQNYHSQVYLIEKPESRELLGLNIYVGL